MAETRSLALIEEQFKAGVLRTGAKTGAHNMRPGFKRWKSLICQVNIIDNGTGAAPNFKLQSRLDTTLAWHDLQMTNTETGVEANNISADGIYTTTSAGANIRLRQSAATTNADYEAFTCYDGFY